MDPAIYMDGKINDLSRKPNLLINEGPEPLFGLVGGRFHLNEKMAVKLSNTTKGTLHQGIYQLVRVDPLMSEANRAAFLTGRPVFWKDMSKFEVTDVAATTALLAGIALNVPTRVGDFIHICVEGDVAALYAAALTKAVPALNDPVVISIAASLATVDVILDATSWTNVQQKSELGVVNEAPVINVVKRIILTKAIKCFNEGIM